MVVSFSVVIIGHFIRVRRERRTLVADETKRNLLPPVITVKEIVRPDGRERVRIFLRPEGTYGVAIDHAPLDELGWCPPTSLGTGAVYASVEIAEREISLTLPWRHTHEENA
jgi:hypothetical protein